MPTSLISGQGRKYREYSKNPTKPLMIYLHGSGQLGSDPAVIDAVGFVTKFVSKFAAEFTILAPQQTLSYTGWQGAPQTVHDAVEFIQWAMEEYDYDGRIYVTGHSMGGQGTWDVATLMGAVITAFIAVSAHSDNYQGVKAMSLLHIPAKHYHGDKDNSIHSYAKGKQTCGWYKPENGDILNTLVGQGHGIDSIVYNDDNMAAWFLSKGAPIVVPPPVDERVDIVKVEKKISTGKIVFTDENDVETEL